MKTDFPWSLEQMITVLSVFSIPSNHSSIYGGNIIPNTFLKKYGKEFFDNSISIEDMKSRLSTSMRNPPCIV